MGGNKKSSSHISGVQSWLNKPFPAAETIAERIFVAFWLGLSIFLILALLQPFGLKETFESALYPAFVYGITTFSTVLFCNAMMLISFPKFSDPRHRTIRSFLLESLIIITVTAVVNWVMNGLISSSDHQLIPLYKMMIYTWCVAFFPLVLMAWGVELKLYRSFSRRAEEVTLLIQNKKENHCPTISFALDNETSVALSCEELLYARSEGNYVQLILADEAQTSYVIRTPLKAVFEKFECCQRIIQCHRSFLINTTKVTEITGNARGYEITLENSSESIPVSRSRGKEVLRELASH